MKGREETKATFIRDALNYWMSVDRNRDNLLERLEQAEKIIAMQEKRIEDLEKYPDQCLEYQNKIITEKEKIICLLTKQLNQKSDSEYCYSDNVVEETVAEPKPEYTKNPGT